MRIISTRVHGVLDYTMGFVLIWTPWIFSFNEGDNAQWMPMIVGLVLVMYSLITNYEHSVAGSIAMRTHLMMDFLSGSFLAASPWIFGFHNTVNVPHLVLGVFLVAMSLSTERKPFRRNRPTSLRSNAHRRYHF
jgi:hypothetical protein